SGAMAFAALRPVALTPERIAGGLLLSAEAGWNQIADDWRFMLDAGAGFGFADGSDRLVASGLTVDFADYAWISMILVTPAWRRLGAVSGFVMARPGRLSAQIGPLVAEDDATALALLARAGQAIGGPVCLDLFDQRRALRDWLDGLGFRPLTRFFRMVRGPAA